MQLRHLRLSHDYFGVSSSLDSVREVGNKSDYRTLLPIMPSQSGAFIRAVFTREVAIAQIAKDRHLPPPRLPEISSHSGRIPAILEDEALLSVRDTVFP